MKARIRIEIPIEATDLNETLKIKVRGRWWSVVISETKMSVTSQTDHEIPGSEWKESDIKLDRKLNNLIDTVMGHVRNATYFAYGISMQWGYEAFYGGTRASDSLDMFPSIHQAGMSTKFDPAILGAMKSMFEDVGSSKLKPLIIMLNYFRRAKELGDLGFHAEAFLNYYKILECLEEMDENQTAKIGLLNKFAPVKLVGGIKDRVPMVILTKKFGKRRNRGSLVSHIEKSSKMLATANFTKVSSKFMSYFMGLTDMRNGYNVAHTLAYYNKYDTYRGVGQHSDEFEYVIADLSNIEDIAQLFMLNYAFPKKYDYDFKNRKWLINKV
ncbi:hypothetical protein A2707_03940 [Candidatus Saccharibacteria bacterium RIFCSPHIGHO2_01_FULL_45_15]|nr:MAG: hypothetical protein A2707_03940 [Candidatus Saccharibacteria bacterium RIFCSPHIGHO2_01_FULL_45_15]OGL31576.1 MAG: hypothetical protein A3E76_02480 [Candidatus Saccharibacteria bacterium RIFCSPHIGHO2_12_FULL_44_22]